MTDTRQEAPERLKEIEDRMTKAHVAPCLVERRDESDGKISYELWCQPSGSGSLDRVVVFDAHEALSQKHIRARATFYAHAPGDIQWLIEQVRSSDLLPASVGGDGWRPIETAPKDGTRILEYAADDADDMQPQVIIWHKAFPMGWVLSWDHTPCGRNSVHEMPTHWMPLPTPPGEKS